MSKKKKILDNIRQPLLVSVSLMVICGFLFPVLLSGLSAVIFPSQANGSLIEVDGKAVGSSHVGQEFTEPYFMKCRPSAVNYNTYSEDAEGNQTLSDGSEFGGVGSGSNNYAPSNPELTERVNNDIEAFLKANPGVEREDIPTDLMTASGSGLDPNISPASAEIQIPAIAKASGISEDKLKEIVADNTKGKLLGLFGEDIVNVLEVNIDIAEEMNLIK